jgi:hypothetical protein
VRGGARPVPPRRQRCLPAATTGRSVSGVASCRSSVQPATSSGRGHWTSLAFDQDGEAIVPGALAPCWYRSARTAAYTSSRTSGSCTPQFTNWPPAPAQAPRARYVSDRRSARGYSRSLTRRPSRSPQINESAGRWGATTETSQADSPTPLWVSKSSARGTYAGWDAVVNRARGRRCMSHGAGQPTP